MRPGISCAICTLSNMRPVQSFSLSALAIAAAAASCGSDSTDPDGKWILQPTEATVTETYRDVTAEKSWDPDGSAPDVRVEWTCPPNNATGETPIVENLRPQWTTGGCMTTRAALLEGPFLFRVVDVDQPPADPSTFDFIQTAQQIRLVESDLTAGRWVFTQGAPHPLRSLIIEIRLAD